MRRPSLVVVLVLAFGFATSAYATPGALYAAAKKGDAAAVASLLEAKTPVDETSSQGWTPLIIAAYSGHLGVVKQLLDAGADPNLADSAGFTALMQAARFGHLDIVKVLAARKAKLDARPTGSAYAGKTVLHLAVEDKRDAVVTWLIAQKVDVNAADPRGTTPLMLAVRGEQIELVKQLIAAKADVKLVDSQGSDALAMAATRGHTAITSALLDAGAVVDGKDKNGATPLFHAAHGGKADVVKLLLARRASARVRESKFGDTALFRAAQSGSAEVVKLLLAAGAPVDEANTAGVTPLMAAASNGHTSVIQVLIDKGAAKDARDKEQRTAVMRAQKNGHTRAAELLEARGAKVSAGERREADAMARDRWFREETIEKCSMLDVKNVGLERCALSLPTAKAGSRRFQLTVRDMSRLEKGDPQKAKHVLVGAVTPKLAASEYLDVNAASSYLLGDRTHVFVVPVVTGTPNAFTDGRVLLYLFDDAKLRFTTTTPVWTSKACGAGCTEQTVGLVTKGTNVDVEIRQTNAKGATRTVLTWNPKRRALVPKA